MVPACRGIALASAGFNSDRYRHSDTKRRVKLPSVSATAALEVELEPAVLPAPLFLRAPEQWQIELPDECEQVQFRRLVAKCYSLHDPRRQKSEPNLPSHRPAI
jgi:hypothetical protein